jgi:hypothetical protein
MRHAQNKDEKVNVKIDSDAIVKKGKKPFWVGWIFLHDYPFSII